MRLWRLCLGCCSLVSMMHAERSDGGLVRCVHLLLPALLMLLQQQQMVACYHRCEQLVGKEVAAEALRLLLLLLLLWLRLQWGWT